MTARTHQTAACLQSIATDGIDGDRAGPLRNIFVAWKVNPMRAGQVAPVEGTGQILADFAQSVATTCTHKDTFIILEIDALTGAKWLHTYAVKRKSTPRYVMAGHTRRAVHDLYAELLMTICVAAFEPVEQWSWKPGADTVGHDAGLIEARP